jgi:hypothetical protein
MDLETILVPDYIQNAPDVVRRRIRALKKLQLETAKVETDFYKRVHELETAFRTRFNTINKKREQIVTGKVEPTDEECNTKLFNWMTDEQEATFNSKVTASGDGDPKGIPDFWLHTLKNLPGVGDAISDRDEPILHFLTDITVDETVDPPTYTLKFVFAENPYFEDQVLTKHYTLSIGPNGLLYDDVLYSGPSIIATKGCKINWNEGKDVTKKIEGAKDDDDSFFIFFSPVTEKLEKDMKDELLAELEYDFEIGQSIREHVVDKAILYFTGEAEEDYESDGSYDEEEDSSEDEIEQ